LTAIAVIGDLLVDRDVLGAVERLAPDAPVPILEHRRERLRPGGAGLAASLAAAEADVVFVTTASDAEADQLAIARLRELGVTVHAARRAAPVPEKIRVRTDDHVLLRIDRGSRTASAVGFSRRVETALTNVDAILVSDYGGEVAASIDPAWLREHTRRPVIWDPHRLGARPSPGAVVTPNLSEAIGWSGIAASGDAVDTAIRAATELASRWRPAATVTTLGRTGALVMTAGPALVRPSGAGPAVDVCGAGDRFAVTLAVGLADRLDVLGAADAAVRSATEFVRAGHDGWIDVDGALAASTPSARATPRRVVATSGCFDLVHAGHIRMLTVARSLGDRLVVLLNDDDSVRRCKGEGRPIVPVAERAELLGALGVVDEVRVFSEDTPERILGDVRPDVFVKGGDYRGVHLPESDVIAAWGGQTVIVPYENGRSTTELIARSHAIAS
jgi:D-beta-D-heptose 7-phosphate kinase / D-beta-D-heptose 1-phosphate adenosyltransferase